MTRYDKTDIYIVKKDKEKYDKIKNNDGDLKKSNNLDLYLMAALMVFNKNGPYEIEDCKDSNLMYIKGTYISNNQICIIESLATATKKDLSILANPKDVIKISEKYASIGIDILYKKYFENPYGFIEVIEEELVKFCNKNKI